MNPTRLPIFLYGHQIPAGKVIDTPVDLMDLGAGQRTYAEGVLRIQRLRLVKSYPMQLRSGLRVALHALRFKIIRATLFFGT